MKKSFPLLILSLLPLTSCMNGVLVTPVTPEVPVLEAPYSVNPVTSGMAPDVRWHQTAERNRGINSTNDKVIKGWAHSIAIGSAIGAEPEPHVQMDYLQISLYRSGKWVVVARDEYDDGSFTLANGKLYSRANWSYEEYYIPFNGSESAGSLNVYPDSMDYISHWWTAGYHDIRDGDSFRVEARIRIEGGALCQIGVDLKKTENESDVNPAVTTDWYGPTDGKWITISNQYVVDIPDEPLVPVDIQFTVTGDTPTEAWITGDWTAWGVWTPHAMAYSADGMYHYQIGFPSGTPVNLNFSYKKDSSIAWATNQSGMAPNVTIRCNANGRDIPVTLVPNGLTGAQSGYNFFFTAP